MPILRAGRRAALVLGFIALTGATALFAIALLTNWITNADAQESAKLTNEAHGLAATALRNGEVVRGLGMGDVVLANLPWDAHRKFLLAIHSFGGTVFESQKRGFCLDPAGKSGKRSVRTDHPMARHYNG